MDYLPFAKHESEEGIPIKDEDIEEASLRSGKNPPEVLEAIILTLTSSFKGKLTGCNKPQ